MIPLHPPSIRWLASSPGSHRLALLHPGVVLGTLEGTWGQALRLPHGILLRVSPQQWALVDNPAHLAWASASPEALWLQTPGLSIELAGETLRWRKRVRGQRSLGRHQSAPFEGTRWQLPEGWPLGAARSRRLAASADGLRVAWTDQGLLYVRTSSGVRCLGPIASDEALHFAPDGTLALTIDGRVHRAALPGGAPEETEHTPHISLWKWTPPAEEPQAPCCLGANANHFAGPEGKFWQLGDRHPLGDAPQGDGVFIAGPSWWLWLEDGERQATWWQPSQGAEPPPTPLPMADPLWLEGFYDAPTQAYWAEEASTGWWCFARNSAPTQGTPPPRPEPAEVSAAWQDVVDRVLPFGDHELWFQEATGLTLWAPTQA